MTAVEMAMDLARASRPVPFARAGFYKKKASAANKAAGRKHVKGSTPKGVCGPGGGAACHKNYKAKRGTETRQALAKEARAARASGKATPVDRAKAASAGRSAAAARMVGKSKAAAEVGGARARASGDVTESLMRSSNARFGDKKTAESTFPVGTKFTIKPTYGGPSTLRVSGYGRDGRGVTVKLEHVSGEKLGGKVTLGRLKENIQSDRALGGKPRVTVEKAAAPKAAAAGPPAERNTYPRNARAQELKDARRAKAAAAAKAARSKATARMVGKSKEATRRGRFEKGERDLDALVAKQEARRLAEAPARAAEIKAARAAKAKEGRDRDRRIREAERSAAAPKPAASSSKGYSPRADTKGNDVPNPAGRSFRTEAAEDAAFKAYRDRFDYPTKTVDMPPAKMQAERARLDDAFATAPGSRDNFVKLTEVRERMSHLGRAEQDTVILAAVKSKEYTLDSHEGLAGQVTDADRRASIVQVHADKKDRLVYIARRDRS